MRTTLVACTAVGLMLGAATAVAGNGSGVKKPCRNGGWATLYRADGTSFKNEDKCLEYVRGGGKLYTTVRSRWEIDCEAFGGKPALGLVLYCWGWVAMSEGQYSDRNAVLESDCDRITFGTESTDSPNRFLSFCTDEGG